MMRRNSYFTAIVIVGVVLVGCGIGGIVWWRSRSVDPVVEVVQPGSYFERATTFEAETETDREYVTYYPDGTCFCTGYTLIEDEYDEEGDDGWLKGTSSGKYYIENGGEVINVVWDDWIEERYELKDGTYQRYDLVFHEKKIAGEEKGC